VKVIVGMVGPIIARERDQDVSAGVTIAQTPIAMQSTKTNLGSSGP